MIGGVIPHHVHDRSASLLGIVQVGNAVPQTRPQMGQCDRRTASHTAVAVSRSRHDAFKQSQDTAHVGVVVQCRHEMHL